MDWHDELSTSTAYLGLGLKRDARVTKYHLGA